MSSIILALPNLSILFWPCTLDFIVTHDIAKMVTIAVLLNCFGNIKITYGRPDN